MLLNFLTRLPVRSVLKRRLWATTASFALCLACLACEDKKRDVPTWTPADHDNQAKPAPGQVDTKAPRPGMPNLEKHGINDVILATWKQSCMPCHGRIGQGDGPQGVALRPPNFTDARFQKVALDSEMEHAILRGRGRMPAFSHLPQETVRGLVQLVRLMGGRTPEGDSAAPAEVGSGGSVQSSAPKGTK
jgi:hypothetical protein